MSFGPIKDRVRRPIPKVTEQRGGGHAIELSHVRPDRQAPAVIGSTIGGWGVGAAVQALARSGWAMRGQSGCAIAVWATCRHLCRFLRDSSPRSCRSSNPSKRICRTPCSTSARTIPRPLFGRFKTGSRATRTKQFTRRCTLGAPNLSIESTTL